MRSFFVFLSVLIAIFYFLSNCANIKPPTGGPVDTIPPVLIKSIPANKSLNYKGSSVKLEYDEYLKIDNINKQLIITPIIDQEYETSIKKFTVELVFPEPFKDSTTYTFNFQNAIQDITEGNISEDNVIAFSTGNYIDSIYINGKITNLFTNKPVEGYTVCLYRSLDTLDIFNSKPMYLTRTDEEGKYLIENIKNGKYTIYAYNDINSNLICDIPKETFGFLPDTLDLNSNIDSLFMNVFYVDMRPLEIQRSGPSGQYFEIKMNKNIIEYDVSPIDSTVTLFHNFGEDQKTIRFYNTFQNIDSVEFYFSALDSIDQETVDTLFLKFTESKRKPLDFNYIFTPENNAKITDHFKGSFEFNKPILRINKDSLFFKYDSVTYEYVPDDSLFTFNKRKDKLSFSLNLSYSDYLEKLSKRDTVIKDPKESPGFPGKGTGKGQSSKLTFHIGTASIISVEKDTINPRKFTYSMLQEEEYGILKGNIISYDSSYTVQLLNNSNLNIIHEINRFGSLYSNEEYTFNNIKPGEYMIRVIIDNNYNGKWDPGNIFKKTAPEKIYFFPEILSIRANWELTDINLEF